MSDPALVLRHHLEKARADREFHAAKGLKNNFDLHVAGLKIAWLKAILREIGAPMAELNQARDEALRYTGREG